MILSNKKLTFISTLPITMWGIIFCIGLTIASLMRADDFRLTMYFSDNINLIMICFLYGLIGLTVNRIFEVYEERQLRRQNEGIL